MCPSELLPVDVLLSEDIHVPLLRLTCLIELFQNRVQMCWICSKFFDHQATLLLQEPEEVLLGVRVPLHMCEEIQS